MAVTLERSDVFTNIVATPPKINLRPAMLQYRDWTHTQGVAAGDANSTIEVWRIPAGSRLYLQASTIRFPAYAAGRVLSFGWRVYTEADGTVVAANLTGLFSGLDVSTAGERLMGEAPTLGAGVDASGTRLFRGTADLVLQVTGGTIAAGIVTSGMLAYAPAGT